MLTLENRCPAPDGGFPQAQVGGPVELDRVRRRNAHDLLRAFDGAECTGPLSAGRMANLETAMVKQKLLILYSENSSLASPVVGWSLYDGTGEYDFDASDDADPPYASVLGAMRDGWRVIQLPVMQAVDPGEAQQLGYLRFETVLEKLEGKA